MALVLRACFIESGPLLLWQVAEAAVAVARRLRLHTLVTAVVAAAHGEQSALGYYLCLALFCCKPDNFIV